MEVNWKVTLVSKHPSFAKNQQEKKGVPVATHMYSPVTCNEQYNSSDKKKTKKQTFCCTKITNSFHLKM